MCQEDTEGEIKREQTQEQRTEKDSMYELSAKNDRLNSDREVGNLMAIRDHYPKYVVTLNEMDKGIENGIKIVHLSEFLVSDSF